MDNQLKYVLSGVGISIPLLLIARQIPDLIKDSAVWILVICMAAAGIITLIVELFFISQKLYGELKSARVKASSVHLLNDKE